MTTRTRLAGIITAITMTAALAACSSASDSDGGDASSGSEMSDQVAAGSPAKAESRGGIGAPAEDSTSSAESASTVADLSSPPSERAVISTGTVSLRSKDVAEARREMQRVVDAQGGDITNENTETDEEGTTSYSRLVVRVPSAKFSAAMLALEEAAELRASNRGAEDVTTQVIDTDVRVRAQQASLKRVELLLSRAESLKDIIWIESQLTSRQAELDSLNSQQSWLRDQTTLSTITVDITAVTEKTKKKEDEAGFLAGLRGGIKALTASTAALATVIGALVPFAILLLVLGFPVWLVVRRRRAAPAPLADV